MKIFDLHTHILPCVDDGASSMEQSLEMLKNAVASDVSSLVLTPHCNIPGVFDNYRSEHLINLFNQLRREASDIPINIYLGAEVRVTEDLPALLKHNKVFTLNESRYLLTEFPVEFNRNLFSDALKVIISQGYIPIVAHPERYSAVCNEPLMVEDWLNIGCHIQLTGGSIMGKYGSKIQKTSNILLENDYVCCIASDAHDKRIRSNFLLDVYSYVSLYYGKQYANILMWENPERICNNVSL